MKSKWVKHKEVYSVGKKNVVKEEGQKLLDEFIKKEDKDE